MSTSLVTVWPSFFNVIHTETESERAFASKTKNSHSSTSSCICHCVTLISIWLMKSDTTWLMKSDTAHRWNNSYFVGGKSLIWGGVNKFTAKAFVEDWSAHWLVQFLDESSLSIYALDHLLKSPDPDTWPCWLGYCESNAPRASLSNFRTLEVELYSP